MSAVKEDETPQGPLDRPLAFTLFESPAATKKTENRKGLRSFADVIRTTSRARKEWLPWIKLARFGETRTDKGSLRHDANVITITGIEADYDGEKVSFDQGRERLEKQGIAACIYTSPSHTEDAPRWRVLCPFSEEIAPERRTQMLGRLNGLLGGILSAESWTLSQSYYFGCVNDNPSHRVELIDGTPIDQHDDLDEIWIGKPATGSSNSSGPHGTIRQSGPLNIAAVLNAIRTADSYHEPMIRLAGYYSNAGKSYVEIIEILQKAMQDVFPPDRDARWQARYDDIPRCVMWAIGRDAKSGRMPGERQQTYDRFAEEPANNEGAKLRSFTLPAILPSKLPPRAWAYGNFLLFGEAACLAAVDGGGKGGLTVAIIIDMITGAGLLDFHTWRTGPVAIVTYEDKPLEWQRRIAAACLARGLDYSFVIEQVHFITRPNRPVCFAAPGRDGNLVFPDRDELIAELRRIGAVLLVIDPLNRAHTLPD